MTAATMGRQPANDNGATGKDRQCPICGKPATSEARPFCSKRCADVDLHRWLGGSYAIPARDGPELIRDDDSEP